MKFVIEAIVGRGFKGDIAIDDIVITDKKCRKFYEKALNTEIMILEYSLFCHFSNTSVS